MSCDFKRPEEPFLSLETCLRWVPLAEMRGVSEVARSPRGFLKAYEKAGGLKSGLTCAWRIKRSNFCFSHHQGILQNESGKLWEEEGKFAGLPTRHALALVMWAWHPDPKALARSHQILARMLRDLP